MPAEAEQKTYYNGATRISTVLRQLLLTKSQVELAKELGVSQGWISDRVCGRRKSIQKRLRVKVANALAIPVAHLIKLSGK